jgi:succinyl-CoA synthetase beta subunit
MVVKSQVHAGGRGRAGGIKTAASPEEAEGIAKSLIGTRLVTHQTTPEGVPVGSVLIEEAVEAQRELYLGIVNDTSAGMPLMMASEAGGVEIEEIAQKSPEKIFRAYIDPAAGFRPFQARRLSFAMNLVGAQQRQATELMSGLYKLYQEKDCSLAEINPLVLTADGRLLALDAKLNFDDNAMFRHKDIAELRDREQEDRLEVEAKDKGIENYVKLDGNIGIMVNGAGLAMSVMDALKQAGGTPANFLDIGTVNNTERVVNSFEILTSDPKVKAVLVNIFGGMARVDVIATGIVDAFKKMSIDIPVVVRLAGTNVAEGERILAESGLNLIRAATFREAVEKAVAAAKTA